MLVLHTRIQSNCVSIQYSQSQFAKDTSSDTYLHSIESCYVTVQIISPVIVVPWKRRVSWLCVLWHIHEQFHFTYLWIQSTTLYSIWLVFSTKKHSVSSAKPPVHPLHTRTLIYAMCCLVWKQVLLYRASPSPFFFNWGRPEFIFVLRQTGAHTYFWVLSDRTSHIRIFVPIFHVSTPISIISIYWYVYFFELLSLISKSSKTIIFKWKWIDTFWIIERMPACHLLLYCSTVLYVSILYVSYTVRGRYHPVTSFV
jgi:hypothetical protein